jgi:hypothetical protein
LHASGTQLRHHFNKRLGYQHNALKLYVHEIWKAEMAKSIILILDDANEEEVTVNVD